MVVTALITVACMGLGGVVAKDGDSFKEIRESFESMIAMVITLVICGFIGFMVGSAIEQGMA